MARRDDREYRAIFEGGATQPAGMHRRPNAAGLSPRAVKRMLQLHRHSSGAASLLHANAAAAPGARLCNASRAPGSRASRRTTCEFRAFFVGGADLLGACSHFADTLLGLRLLCLACALAIAGNALAGAQRPQPTFRSGTRLMVQTVTVKDKEGRPVEGLTSKDFIVSEDGAPQTVSFAEFQRLPDRSVEPTAAPAPSVAAPRSATVAPATQGQISTPPSGDTRYRDRRLLVLFFDLTAMPPPDQMRAYTAAKKFIDTEMQPADLLAIMTFGGGAVRVKQDFTGNRVQLRDVMDTLIYGDDKDGDGIPYNTDIGTAFGQDDAEFSILNTDRQLSALQTAATMLRPLPEQKSLIYFASGLRLNGVDNQAQLRATTNAAIRANVSLFPI